MSTRVERTARNPLRVDLGRRTTAKAPGQRSIATWAAAALGPKAAGKEIAVQVVTPAAIRRLKRASGPDWRAFSGPAASGRDAHFR